MEFFEKDLTADNIRRRLNITKPVFEDYVRPKLLPEHLDEIESTSETYSGQFDVDGVDRERRQYYSLVFHCSLRLEGGGRRYQIEGQWVQFVRDRGLRVGSRVRVRWCVQPYEIQLWVVSPNTGFPPSRWVRTPTERSPGGPDRPTWGSGPKGGRNGLLGLRLRMMNRNGNGEFEQEEEEEEEEEEEGNSQYVGVLKQFANFQICYDIWGHSLSNDYVKFFSSNEAAKAMSMLNHINVKGKPMTIMWCERNPITRKTGKANLFVKNLDSSIDSAHLDSIFSKSGTVLSCKVAEDGNGKSKGFGFVQFDQEESAKKALNSLHDTLLAGKKLYVSNFMKSSQRNQTFTNLYVKNLRKDVTEDDLKEKFSKYGKVNSAAIMKDNLGISKGYGFVSFGSPEDAKKAMEALNGTSDLGCDSLFVGRAQKKVERERMMKESLAKRKACSVHVIGLSPNVDEAMIKSHFSVFGKVVQARVLRYPNVTSAWVTFSSPSEAKAAASSLFGLSSIQEPLYGAKVQCMEGERNYPPPVKQYFPSDSAAGNIVNPTSHFKRDEGLNLLTAYRNATANTKYDNHKFLPNKSMKTTCSSTGSSSTAINIRSCKNLRVFVPKTEAKYGGRTTGMKMKMNELDQVKQSGKSSLLMQQIRDTIQVVLDSKGRCLNASSPFKPLTPAVV